MQSVSRSSFISAILKVEWAYKHINNLSDVLQITIENGVCRIFKDVDDQGRFILRLQVKGTPPEIPLLVGDIVHNLRSALDHTWNVLARQSRTSTSRLTFPTHETRENLMDAVSKSPVKQAFPQAEALLRDAVKPWKEGNFPIWALGKLDNKDKHNMIHATHRVTVIPNIGITWSDGRIMRVAKETKIVGSIDCSIISSASDFTFDGNIDATFDPVFSEGEIFEDDSIIPTVVNLAEATTEVVQAFIDTFGVGDWPHYFGDITTRFQ